MITTVDILVDFGLSGLGPVAGGGSGALQYHVVDADGGDLVARTNVGIVEFPAGSGIYHAKVANWDTAWVGRVIWDDGAGHYAAEAFFKVGDQAAGSSGSGGVAGPGADQCTLTVTRPDGVTPIADADVWLTATANPTPAVAGTLRTDSNGRVTFLLDAGDTYYLWAQKDGEQAIRGQVFVAVKD